MGRRSLEVEWLSLWSGEEEKQQLPDKLHDGGLLEQVPFTGLKDFDWPCGILVGNG